jgi:hypothetical protein
MVVPHGVITPCGFKAKGEAFDMRVINYNDEKKEKRHR